MSTIVVSSGITSSGLVIGNGTELVVGGTVIDTLVSAGGVASIIGTASGTVIGSGGTEYNDGTTIGTVVQSGGFEFLYEGTATGSIISGGSEYVYSGAVANGTTVDGGIQVVVDAVASGTIVGNGGTMAVVQGGIATDITVLSGGQFLNSGSELSGATISAGGVAVLLDAAATTGDLLVESGGELIVVPGADATGATIAAGGIVITAGVLELSDFGLTSAWASGATVVGLVVSGGTVQVYSGSTLQSADITGGALYISGGTAIGTEFDPAPGVFSYLFVESGGAELGGTITGNATEIVSQGGLVSGTTIEARGELDLLSGTASGVVVGNVGYMTMSGGAMDGTIIQAGGDVLVYGGTLDATTVQSEGVLRLQYATAQGTFLSAGATEDIFRSTESGAVIGGGAVLNVTLSDVQDATVDRGGTINIQDSDPDQIALDVTDTHLDAGGVLKLSSVAYDSAANASFDQATDQLTVTANGADIVLQLAGSYSGDQFRLFQGPDGVLPITVTDGSDMIGSGVTSSGLVVSYPENLVVDGGTVISTTITSGGAITVENGGLAMATLVGSDGSEIAQAGGLLSLSVIGAYGSETISAGGIARGATVGSAAMQNVLAGGVADATLVGSSGVVTVASGALLSGGFIGNGGLAYIPGGTVDGLTIGSGGSAYIQGNANGVVVQGGGIMELIGVASATIVSGGTEGVYNATDTGALVEAGGIQEVDGTAISAVISAGGTQIVVGVAIDTVVASGGTQSGNGAISATLIEAGGRGIYDGGSEQIHGLSVQSGGLAVLDQDVSLVDGAVASGATLILLPGAQLSSSTIASGARVVSTGAIAVQGTGAAQAGAVVSGLSLSDGVAYALAGGTLENITASGSDIVVLSGGIAGGLSFTDGAEIVSSGGIDRGAVIGSGAGQDLLSGAIASDTTILAGGVQSDAFQGYSGTVTMTDTVVMSGGQQIVESVALDTVVSAGGIQAVFGSSIGTVLHGGEEYADGGGLFYGPAASISATQVYSGGVLALGQYGSATDTVLNFGGVLTDFGDATGTLIDAGGSMQLLDGIYYGLLDRAGPGGASGTVIESGGTLVVGTGDPSAVYPYTLYAQVTGATLEQGGVINLKDVGYSSSLEADFNTATGQLTVSDPAGGPDEVLSLDGDYTGDYFHLAEAADGSVLVTVDNTPCYCRGTLIATDRGDIPVEDLAIGDRLISASGAARPLRWIGRRAYDGRFAATNKDVLPIRIHAGALGGGLPRRDLWVSPLHAMYLDGVLIPAHCLVNGQGIEQIMAVERVAYFHLELESHDLIVAEGAISESYLEDANRAMFHNAAEYAARYPDAAPHPRPCAPRLEDGPVVEAVRRRLAAPAALPVLEGWLDLAAPDRIAGWAAAGAAPVHLRLLANGITLGETTANLPRADVQAARRGGAECGFEFPLHGQLSPGLDYEIRVVRAEDGAELPNCPLRLQTAALSGQIDRADRMAVQGWAVQGWASSPDGPVALQILVDGVLEAEVLAHRYRADIAQAGIGAGRHGFVHAFPGGLSADCPHVIEIRRARDGVALAGSPWSIGPQGSFQPGMLAALRAPLAGLGGAERASAHRMLLDLAETLCQADADEQATPLLWQASARARRAGAAATRPPRRALLIAAGLPDAAALSGIAALRSAGYRVGYVDADHLATDDTLPGLRIFGLPLYASVEDVLRRQSGGFELIRFQHPGLAACYLPLCRRWMPQAAIEPHHSAKLARTAKRA